MEKRLNIKIANHLSLDFKKFLSEMSHIIFRDKGQMRPIPLEGAYAVGLDMRFEAYPNGALKNRLSMLGAKFFGQLPGEEAYLVFDGDNATRQDLPPKESDYIKLPDDWYDYAFVEFLDGSTKNPIVK